MMLRFGRTTEPRSVLGNGGRGHRGFILDIHTDREHMYCAVLVMPRSEALGLCCSTTVLKKRFELGWGRHDSLVDGRHAVAR